MLKLTKQEFFDKYKGTVFKFDSYYKFVFSYKAVISDNTYVIAKYGGDPNDIYRLEVTARDELSLLAVEPKEAYVFCQGRLTEYFYDDEYDA